MADGIGEDHYTTTQAAKILGLTGERVRQIAPELEGKQDERGRWKIPQRVVHARLEEMRGGDAADSAPDSAANLLAAIRDLEYRLGRAESRAELTERAESTMREERQRLLADLQNEKTRVEEAQEETRRLRDELDKARRPFWRRWFG